MSAYRMRNESDIKRRKKCPHNRLELLNCFEGMDNSKCLDCGREMWGSCCCDDEPAVYVAKSDVNPNVESSKNAQRIGERGSYGRRRGQF